MKSFTYLIIGGGMTADAAVKGIREKDKKGEIGLITAEGDAPYERPPLSKGLWTEDKDVEDIDCDTAQKGVTIIKDTRAVSLDTTKQEVQDDAGRTYRYNVLLLATGGQPVTLPFDGDRVIYFRSRADYRRLREWTKQGEHFAVIGGSFIGAEIAAALATNRNKATMIFPEATPLAGLLPPTLAQSLSRYYEEQGVTLVPARKPAAMESDGDVLAIELDNGHRFTVDGAVVGIGIEPDTALAETAGLEIDDGIKVDEHLRTSAPQVYAAGDVANFWNPALNTRLRVEHEDNALTMGKMAGRNMAGDTQVYHHLPYFYGDLFDVGYEAVGETDSSLEIVTDVNEVKDKGCIFYLREQRVRGIVFWNLFDHIPDGRELIASSGPHTKEDLKAWNDQRLD